MPQVKKQSSEVLILSYRGSLFLQAAASHMLTATLIYRPN